MVHTWSRTGGSPAGRTGEARPILSGVPPMPPQLLPHLEGHRCLLARGTHRCTATPRLPREPPPGQFVAEEEKDCLLLSSGPIFCDR